MSKYFILFETDILLDLIYMVYTQWNVLIAEFLYLETFSQSLSVLGAQEAQQSHYYRSEKGSPICEDL